MQGNRRGQSCRSYQCWYRSQYEKAQDERQWGRKLGRQCQRTRHQWSDMICISISHCHCIIRFHSHSRTLALQQYSPLFLKYFPLSIPIIMITQLLLVYVCRFETSVLFVIASSPYITYSCDSFFVFDSVQFHREPIYKCTDVHPLKPFRRYLFELPGNNKASIPLATI